MLTVVRHKSGTVAIDVHFHFEHAICQKTYFRFRCNASIYLHTKSSERERRCGLNKKKIHEFIIHIENSIRIAIDAGSFDASLRHCLHRIPQFQSNRPLILLLKA
jgi:hypothetical protein